MSSSNPFAALVDLQTSRPKNITKILEDVFGFTLNKENYLKKQQFYLEDVSNNFNKTDLDLAVLQHALFDRLFFCTEENSALVEARSIFDNTHICETNVVIYLYNCYRNSLENVQLSRPEQVQISELIVKNVATSMIQAEIYSGQQLEAQLLEILKNADLYYENFFKDVCKAILMDEEGGLTVLHSKLKEVVQLLTDEVKKLNIITFNYNIFELLKLFTNEEYLAEIFLDCKPAKFTSGADYSNTLLGALLNISILPKTPNGAYEHFVDTTDSTSISSSEGILWSNLNNLTRQIHAFVFGLLTCSPKIKNKTLEWLGACLKSNADRGKLWNAHQPAELNPANYTTVSDGFMINLSNVMLRLCQPFCTNFEDIKILKVDPFYCAVPNDEQPAKNIHLPNISSETCLIPKNENELISTSANYGFVTECFFMAHRAVHLGYQVGNDKLVQLNQQVGRMERALVDAAAQSTDNVELVSQLKQKFSQELTKYLSLKAQLSDPIFLKLLFNFASSSSFWLCQVAATDIVDKALNKAVIITFPLPETIPECLKCIPEFVLENIVTYLVFLRRFNPKIFEEVGYEKLKPLLTLVLVFMGSQERVKNPHLRARLAEALDALLPYHDDTPPAFTTFGSYQRELLFTQHEHRLEIVGSLLKVFVGIEMTGQNVEFEQKFNYRRPMYAVMDYLWEKKEYQKSFLLLAEEAERNMDGVTPPLFLRFINLLMNDAVYLLDESLSNMSKLKEMQTARQNGEWNALPAQERAQNMSYMQHIGMLAKFDNILGRDTIKTLKKLTSKIKLVFTHATMVDRIAAMLNYFLYNLVGPKKTQFKVKDQKEYSFDPAATVLNICEIYVNLKGNDAFCLAVSQDGRSYSPELFELAEDVLIRIGGNVLICELKEVAERVAEKAKEQHANEEAIGDAPEHFLDPIMSALMTDPVILPSSKQTVDRTTIARHLLSDQTDPFNREPLSMDQVIPNLELANEIKKWLEERRKKF